LSCFENPSSNKSLAEKTLENNEAWRTLFLLSPEDPDRCVPIVYPPLEICIFSKNTATDRDRSANVGKDATGGLLSLDAQLSYEWLPNRKGPCGDEA
jgi:hypothetical protein